MSSETTGRRTGAGTLAAAYIVLTLGGLAMFSPYALEILTSLKTYPETLRIPPALFPASPQWGNFVEVTTYFPVGIQLWNTALSALVRVAGQLLFCSMAAFAFARLDFPFKKTLFAIVLCVLMVPGQLFLIPQYQVIAKLGWLDTIQALFLPGIVGAFGVFLLRQFLMSLPMELDEAAKLDGANPWQVYFYIHLPLIRPALVALALLTLVASWNDLLWPLVVNSTPEKLPVSVGLANLSGQFVQQYQLIMAGSIIVSAPIIVLFLVLQRQFIAGFVSSGLK